MNAAITATAKYLPERILSNLDLEKMVDTTDEWIRTRTGIETRHIVSEGQASADMATKVAKILLERSGTNKNVSKASYAGYIFSNLPPFSK